MAQIMIKADYKYDYDFRFNPTNIQPQVIIADHCFTFIYPEHSSFLLPSLPPSSPPLLPGMHDIIEKENLTPLLSAELA